MNFDRDSVIDRMVTKLRGKASWSQILFYSTNKRLIDVVGDEIAELARYGEENKKETRWKYAQNRTSLVAQCESKRYRPHRKIGATGSAWISANKATFSNYWNSYTPYVVGDLARDGGYIYEVTIDNIDTIPSANQGVGKAWVRKSFIYPNIVPIPKYTALKATDGAIYSTIADTSLTTVGDYVEIPVVQGIKKTYTVVAEGNPFEEIEISLSDIDDAIYEVKVNNISWREVEYIQAAEESEAVFELENKVDFSGIYLKFGNDITGKSLSKGDTITFIYLETKGSSGNITTKGAINSVEDSLIDNNGVTVPLFAHNDDAIVEGKDYETADEIRLNASQFAQSEGLLAGEPNYEQFLRSFPFVQKAVVWGAYQRNKDEGRDLWEYVPTNENLVFISAYTTGDTPVQLTSEQKVQIIEEAVTKNAPTDILSFVDTQFVYMDIHVEAFIKSTDYRLSDMKTLIQKKLWDEYNISKKDFKEDLYNTPFDSFIQNIEGIHHHNSYLTFFDEVLFTSQGPYTAAGIIPLAPLLPSTVKVYVMDTSLEAPVWELVAHDDGNGNLTGDNAFVVASSTVIYATGAVTVNVTTGLSKAFQNYKVKMGGRLVSEDAIIETRNQVFYLKSVDDVQTQYK